ncbi:MAG: FTR1 family protein [Cardiobacteriaceae bacterium]|nr:FTR1 family protein [Cardiobacteriaceae bacterium]
MNKIIWAKRFWAKELGKKRFGEYVYDGFYKGFILLALWFGLLSQSALANDDLAFNPLYVELSDAMGAVKIGQTEKALSHLQHLQTTLSSITPKPEHQSAFLTLEQAIHQSLENPNLETLGNLSKALYDFEKATKPVNYAAKREQFTKRVFPIYQQLDSAVQAADTPKALEIYARFNRTWTVNEKTVRDTSLGHYGQIEGAMNFLRIALSQNPPNIAEAQKQSALLGNALRDFQSGSVLEVQTGDTTTLSQGVALLQSALSSMERGQTTEAFEQLNQFLQAWVIFEGSVRTRDAQLYHQTESILPHIIANLDQPQSHAELKALIDSLSAIDEQAHYGIIDAMLVLLREGLEAVVIIVALVTVLRQTQPRAISWVYAGSAVGLVASLLAAFALHSWLPVATAGIGREMIEGLVGILAVVMMMVVGAWLHGKASIQGWKRFVETKMHQAMASSSVQRGLWGMAGLAFLSVFREGAETILFYASMLPLMEASDLWLGVLSALSILAVVGWLMSRSSHKLPIHRWFALMTVGIYLLGFKILGISIHTLQLTQTLPRHSLELIPPLPIIGWYNSWEGLIAQTLFFLAIPLMRKCFP